MLSLYVNAQCSMYTNNTSWGEMKNHSRFVKVSLVLYIYIIDLDYTSMAFRIKLKPLSA